MRRKARSSGVSRRGLDLLFSACGKSSCANGVEFFGEDVFKLNFNLENIGPEKSQGPKDIANANAKAERILEIRKRGNKSLEGKYFYRDLCTHIQNVSEYRDVFKSLQSQLEYVNYCQPDLKAAVMHTIYVETRARRLKDWSNRIANEILASPRTWWITLTFRPEDLPDGAAAVRKLGQRWLRQLRRNVVADVNWRRLKDGLSALSKDERPIIRHCMQDELGETKGRLHLHALVYCDDIITKRAIEFFVKENRGVFTRTKEPLWEHGSVKIKLVKLRGRNAQQEAYGVADYISKYMDFVGSRILSSGNPAIGYVTPINPEHNGPGNRLRYFMKSYRGSRVPMVGDLQLIRPSGPVSSFVNAARVGALPGPSPVRLPAEYRYWQRQKRLARALYKASPLHAAQLQRETLTKWFNIKQKFEHVPVERPAAPERKLGTSGRMLEYAALMTACGRSLSLRSQKLLGSRKLRKGEVAYLQTYADAGGFLEGSKVPVSVSGFSVALADGEVPF